MAIKIFISHRHSDKEIADVLTNHLIYWGVDREEIFQSSSAGYGAEKGRSLTEQLKKAVHESKVVFLIYTFEEADWSYCMWEAGLAEGIESTNVIVIQCKLDTPKLFRDKVNVKLEQEDIRAFVKDFHTKENFFPGQPPYYRQKIDEQVLVKRSQELYEDLIKVIPPGEYQPRYRWDFLVLELSAEATKRLKECDDNQSVDIVKNEGIVRDTWGNALKHFGFVNREPGLRFGILALRWKENFGDESDAWIGQVCSEIKRAAENRPAESNWEKMRSIFHRDWYFYPVLNLAQMHPDGGMDLHIYLYQVPE